MEKTTKELMEEKEKFNKEIEDKIYESMQVSMAKSRAAKAELIAAKQKYEDDGWNSSCISPNQPVIVEEPIIEEKPKEKAKPHVHPHSHPEPPVAPIIPKKSPVELEREELQEQIDIMKQQLELMKAEKELAKEENAELIEEVIKEGE